ncbi:MAG: DUF1727 domain-containing protein [Eubacterium sp.]|nr:DUF1727 domain-containing protein [Eubacterium sp.]
MFSVFFSLLFARAVSSLLRLFKKGATTLPGRVALFIKYDILSVLSKDVRIICVTGTNGKTTTCALIEQALVKCQKSCFINKSGANMLSGVTTSFVINSTLFGRCKKDFAILECDENSLPLISRYIDAEVLAVTNIFRDQLDRYGEVSHTLGVIKNGIDNMQGAILVLNADCPLTNSLSSGNSVTFGIDADYRDIDVMEARYCPRCQRCLVYDKRVFSHLGAYRCTGCDYKRGRVDFEARNIRLLNEKGSEFELVTNNKRFDMSCRLGGIYNVYNILCAAAVLSCVGIDDALLLSDFEGAFGRLESFYNGEQRIMLLLVKNPVGMSSCIKYVSKLDGVSKIVFALNDNYADGRDISWIWDSDFEPLSGDKSYYTFGTRSEDMAVRLKYSGVKTAKTLSGEDINALMGVINSDGDTVILANYTAMMKIRPYLKREFGGKEFWQ